jgi:dihydrofolate synthase/folylpolyglutamate synthase
VDIAVIEVGLGGRLDATNIITPEVCAMTAISLDHTSVLGSTIAEIAGEKAGIFKPHTPIVSVPQVAECEHVYRELARISPAPIAFLEQEIDFSRRFETGPSGTIARIGVETGKSSFEHVPVPLAGVHQPVNCGLALSVIDRLRQRNWHLPDAGVMDGLAATVLPGRMEIVSDDPRIIIDGAHNPESVASLMKTICTNETYDSLFLIFGCAIDKDIDGMLTAVASAADKVVFTRSNSNPRAALPEMLQERFAKLTGRSTMTAPDVVSALGIATSAVQRRDLVVVTGSFYVVGQARRTLLPNGINPRLVVPAAPRASNGPVPEIIRDRNSARDIRRWT